MCSKNALGYKNVMIQYQYYEFEKVSNFQVKINLKNIIQKIMSFNQRDAKI